MKQSAKNNLSYLLKVIAFAALYHFNRAPGLENGIFAGEHFAVWPPTGVSIAVLLLSGLSFWPGVSLGFSWVQSSPALLSCWLLE